MRVVVWLCIAALCFGSSPSYGAGLKDLVKKAKKQVEKKAEEAQKTAAELKKEADKKAQEAQKTAERIAKEAPGKAAQLQKDAQKTATQLQKATAEKAAEAQKTINKLAQDAAKKKVPIATKTTTTTTALQAGAVATAASSAGGDSDLLLTNVVLSSESQTRNGILISESADSLFFLDSEMNRVIMHQKKPTFNYQRVYLDLAGEEQLSDDSRDPLVDCCLSTMVRKVLTEKDQSAWTDNLQALKDAVGDEGYSFALSKIQIKKNSDGQVRTLDTFGRSPALLAAALSSSWKMLDAAAPAPAAASEVSEAASSAETESGVTTKPVDSSANSKKNAQAEAIANSLTKKLQELQKKLEEKKKK